MPAKPRPQNTCRALAAAVLFLWGAAVGAEETNAPEPALPEGPGLETSGPDVYFLPDSEGKLRKVIGFGYEDFLKAWRGEGSGRAAGPPGAVIEAFTGTLDVREDHAAAEVQLVVKKNTAGWVSVPLLMPHLVIDESTLPEEAGVLVAGPRGEGYVLWLRGPPSATTELKLTGRLPLAEGMETTSLSFATPSATKQQLRIDFADEIEVVRATSDVRSVDTEGHTSLVVNDGFSPLEIEWRKPNGAAPRVSHAASRTRVEVSREWVRYTADIEIERGSAAPGTIRVKLPEGVAPVDDRSGSGSGEPGETAVVQLAPTGVTDEKATYRLRAERPLTGGGADFQVEVASFEVLGAYHHSGEVVVSVEPSLRAFFDPSGAIRQVPLAELVPDHEDPGAAAGFRYYGTPWSVVVHTKEIRTVVRVRPHYDLLFSQGKAELTVELDYQISGPHSFLLRIAMSGWELTDSPIESGGVVDLANSFQDSEGRLVMPLVMHDAEVAKIRFVAMKKEIGEMVQLSMPEPLGAQVLPGTLTVRGEPSLQVTPTPEGMIGLSAITDELPPEAGPDEAVHRFRTYSSQPSLAATLHPRPTTVTAEVASRIELREEEIAVLQSLDYLVRFGYVESLSLLVPRALMERGAELSAWLGEDEIGLPAPQEPEAPPGANGAGETVPLKLPLLRRIRGEAHLRLQYRLPPVAPKPGGVASVSVPLVVPADEITEQRVEVSAEGFEAVQLDTTREPSGWQADQSEQPSPDGVFRFTIPPTITAVPLRVESVAADSGSSTVVEKAWVQTWLIGRELQERTAIRFRSRGDVEARFPETLADTAIEARLDGEPVELKRAADGRCRISVEPAEDNAPRSHTLELRWLRPASGGEITATPLVLERREGAFPLLWETVLPRGRVLLSAPRGFALDDSTSSALWPFASAAEARTQEEIENWIGATPSLRPPASCSRYVMASFLPPQEMTAYTTHRAWPLAVVALSCLAAAYLWVSLQGAARHAVLAALAILLAGVAAFAPQLASLIGWGGHRGGGRLRRGDSAPHAIPGRTLRGETLQRNPDPECLHRVVDPTASGRRFRINRIGLEAQDLGVSSLARIAETRRIGLLGLCATLLVACSQPAVAQTEPAPQVRRVFVPVDQVEQALKSGDRFVAFSADRLRELLGENAPGAAPQGPVWCARAVHRAEQAEDGRGLEGISRLTLETYPQAATEPFAEGHLLVLGDTNLIIEAASWVNRPKETPRLGFWHPPEGGTPVQGLLVDEPGELELRWSLPPSADEDGLESYRLHLPASARSRFELVLAKGDAPFLDGNPPEEAKQEAGPSLDRWVFALSPDGRHELRIDPSGPDAAETARLNWSRSTTCRLSPEGVFAEHRLLVAAGPRPGAARLRVRGDARLLQVTATGQDEGARLIAPGGKSATVPLPDPDTPVEIVCRTVSSSLTADRLSGKDDRLWPLPTLQIENGDWTEGDATIEVPPTLRLLDIATTDAGLLQTVPSDEGDNPGEFFRLQEYAPGAVVEIAVRPREQQIEVRAVSTVDLGSLDPVGVYSAEILSSAAPVYELVGRVPEDWQIESVQTVPADSLGAWSVDGPPKVDRSLRVSLASPLLHGESLRLFVGGGLRAESVLLPATSEELRLLQLLGTTRRQHALVLSRGDQQAWNVPREIAEAVIDPDVFLQRYGSLTDAPVRGVAFDLAALDPQQPIDLEPVPAEFSAEVVVEASFSPGACKCRRRIRIIPESGGLASLRIRTTRPLPEEASWSIETGQASVRVTPSSSGTASGSTQYRIALPSALTEPFDLVVESVSPRSESCACIGVEVASAKQSGAWYVIRGDAPSLEIDPGRCLAVPPPVGLLSEGVEGSPVVAAYRLPTYAPLDSLSLPVVTTKPAPADDRPAPRPRLATAEYTLVQSADGAQLCTAQFRLEDRLAGAVEVSLPSGATVRSAWQDGAEVDAETTSGSGPVLRLTVDPLREETTFGVSFQTSGQPLGTCSRVSVPPIETSFEVGEGRLRVWAPPGYRVVDPACEVGLWQRLLGPLSNTTGKVDDQPRSARNQGEAPPGWALYEDRFVGRPEPLTFRGREDAFAVSWPVVFSVALIGGVLLGGRYRIGVAAVVLAAVAVVFAPAGWLTVAQPLFLGVTAAAVIQHLRSTPQEEETADASGGSLPAKTLAVLATLFLITGQPSRAEDQATETPNPIYTVIVPYTPGGAPADEVYISEGLLAALQQKQHLRAVDRFDYLVFRGEYRGTTGPDAAWHLAWDVECRRPDGRILLPLKRDQAQWQEPFRAGGVEVNSRWLPSGEGLWLFLPGPGRYRVEAACVAHGASEESPWRLDLSTPATPLARIELDDADTETTVHCEADGTLRRADDRGRVSFSIASHDHLRLSWSTPESDGLVNPVGPVDLFSWLKIDESAVRLDVLIGVRPKQPEGAVLRLRVPPELEPEPADSSDAGAGLPTRVRRSTDHPDELLVPLAENSERLQQGPLRFRLRRRSSIGRVYPTPLEVVGAEPGRRWLGVSVAAGLSYQHDSNSPREEIRPEEFVAQWGESTPPPQFALAADPTASPWSIYVRPDPAGYSGDQDTRVVIDRQGADVLFNANVDEGNGLVVDAPPAHPAKARSQLGGSGRAGLREQRRGDLEPATRQPHHTVSRPAALRPAHGDRHWPGAAPAGPLCGARRGDARQQRGASHAPRAAHPSHSDRDAGDPALAVAFRGRMGRRPGWLGAGRACRLARPRAERPGDHRR